MKYPSGVKKQFTKVRVHANRGMQLENELNETNTYYLENNIAAIYKKPTPITIAKVIYPSSKEAIIKEAYFKTPSTTDYNGIYKGRYIDFEAKETCLKKHFPLSNIQKHQLNHLEKIIAMGGIGFVIVRFSSHNLTYFLEGSKLLELVNDKNKTTIPLSFFEEFGYVIKDGLRPRLNYLEIVDNLYIKGVDL